MEIKKNFGKTVIFHDTKEGDVFIYNTSCFMKIFTYDGNDDDNAVDLQSGEIANFLPDDKVVLVKAVLTLSPSED